MVSLRRSDSPKVTQLLAVVELYPCPLDHNMTNDRTYLLALHNRVQTLPVTSLLGNSLPPNSYVR